MRQDFIETLVQRLLGFLVRNMGLRGHGFWNMGGSQNRVPSAEIGQGCFGNSHVQGRTAKRIDLVSAATPRNDDGPNASLCKAITYSRKPN